MKFGLTARCLLTLVCTGWFTHAAWSATPQPVSLTQAGKVNAPKATPEARLIEIYKLIGIGQSKEARLKAEQLVKDQPNFQLAHLVYGDLLSLQARPISRLGDVQGNLSEEAATALEELHQESHKRLQAMRERPPVGTIPSQFLALSPRNKHAIAVDAARSRLYLFENTDAGLKLINDFYISVGKSGVEKAVEGDLRTPLGVYFIVSNLDPKSLRNFYGTGALPINYPNVLDNKRGKTGRGIWLHGTPPAQFSRPPLATDGCVVMANPDLNQIIRTVEIRTTPVVITPKIEWVPPHKLRADVKPFEDALAAWRHTKSSGNVDALLRFYTPDFNSNGKTLADWTPALRTELAQAKGRPIELKDLSFLRWKDAADTMVVTFGEVASGQQTGPVKRQYWIRQGRDWKIFYEGIIG